MAAAHDLLDSPVFQTEWKKFDLLVQVGGVNTLIEFKYYLLRRTYGLDGVAGQAKGGPSLKNEAEFQACLGKLRDTVVPGIEQRRLILVYERDGNSSRRRSLHRSYGELQPGPTIARVWPLSVGQLEGRVLEPTP